MLSLVHDVRYAIHRCMRAPGFTIAVTVLLAFGIGANVALFAVTDALLLRPRPGVHDAKRLVWVSAATRGRGRLSYADLDQFRLRSGAFESLAGVRDDQITLAAGSAARPQRLRAQSVTGDFFGVLRAPVVLGRALGPSDDRPDAPLVAVISNGLWLREFGGDASAIGRRVVLNDRLAMVVGVASRGFNGADIDAPRDLWVPTAAWEGSSVLTDRSVASLVAIGRLRDNVTRSGADRALAATASGIAAGDTTIANQLAVRTYSAATGVPPGGAAQAIPVAAFCFAITLTLLLISCANVSNLLLARGIARRREIGVRMAMGASRGRVIRQLLVESALLGTVGAALGVTVAFWATDAFNASGMLPMSVTVSLDARVIAATIAFGLAATLLCGVASAFDATRRDVIAVIKAGAQGLDPRRARAQGRLVVAQVTMSVVLLTVAVLFVQSLRKQQDFDLGFDATNHVLSAGFNTDELRFSAERKRSFVNAIRERVSALPGVEGVTFAEQPPLGDLTVFADLALRRPGGLPVPARAFRSAVDANYFSLLHIPLRSGRPFTNEDRGGAARVAIVSETFAKRSWPGQAAVGQRFVSSRGGSEITVVGVVADVFVWGAAAEPHPLVYFPRAQDEIGLGTHLLVRAAGDASALAHAIEREARAVDPTVPFTRVRTMQQAREESFDVSRTASRIMAIFGALGFVLASVGLYAVLSFAVAQRHREIGVRVALGALGRDVVRLFVARAARMVTWGLGLGLAVSFALSRLLTSMLFGVGSLDVAGAAVPVSVLMLVALVAAWLPSRRAARVDPMAALKGD